MSQEQPQTNTPSMLHPQPGLQSEQTLPGQSPVVVVPPKSEEPKAEVASEEAKPKKLFNRKDVKRFVPVDLALPFLYPLDEYEPFGFKFRFALSRKMEENKQEYLSLSAMEQTEKEFEQALDEVCDLLVTLPTGFDFSEMTGGGNSIPDIQAGNYFRQYVESTTDTDAKQQLEAIVKQASIQYWNSITPRPFRRTV